MAIEKNGVLRNGKIDMYRGIAILMVILGHTISGTTSGFETSVVYNVIWSLQMPLFFLISGYCFHYSRPINFFKSLLRYIGKRTLGYLLPWVVWTFIVRGIIFKQHSFLDLKYLFWHMDAGYWFLISLWFLTVFSAVSSFLAQKLSHNKTISFLLYFVLYTVINGALVVVGIFAGFSFLCIKQTLYYSIFYALGVAYSLIENRIEKPIVYEIIIAVSTISFVALVTNVCIFTLSDTVLDIAVRFLCSFSGSVAFFGLLWKATSCRFLEQIGKQSLELYLIHYLLLNLFKKTPAPSCSSINGLGLVCLNYCITVSISLLVIWFLSKSELLRIVLFGKPSNSFGIKQR